MELANIEKLLEKYLNAETTLQEEATLRAYFTSGNVALHLQEYGILFGYFKENQSESYTKTIELTTLQNRKKRFKWMSLVASVALITSVFIGKQQYEQYQQRKQFVAIKNALEKVSFHLNKGNDALYAVSNNLTKGSNAVAQIKVFPKTVYAANKILNKK